MKCTVLARPGALLRQPLLRARAAACSAGRGAQCKSKPLALGGGGAGDDGGCSGGGGLQRELQNDSSIIGHARKIGSPKLLSAAQAPRPLEVGIGMVGMLGMLGMLLQLTPRAAAMGGGGGGAKFTVFLGYQNRFSVQNVLITR